MSAAGEAFSWSIYLMIGFVFALLGGIVAMMARIVRRIDAAEQTVGPTE